MNTELVYLPIYIPLALIKPAENADEIRREELSGSEEGGRLTESSNSTNYANYLGFLSFFLGNCKSPKTISRGYRRSINCESPHARIKIRKEVLVSIYDGARERQREKERERGRRAEFFLSIIRKVATIRELRETLPTLLPFSISPFHQLLDCLFLFLPFSLPRSLSLSFSLYEFHENRGVWLQQIKGSI